jgi:hypothetical protein
MPDLRTRLVSDLVGTLDAAAMDKLLDANLTRWITEAVADPTPLDQMDPIDAKITKALRPAGCRIKQTGGYSAGHEPGGRLKMP